MHALVVNPAAKLAENHRGTKLLQSRLGFTTSEIQLLQSSPELLCHAGRRPWVRPCMPPLPATVGAR
jgi:hypothetical protein